MHDNALNIVAAMRQVNAISITCSAHNIQLAVSKGLQHDDITNLVSKSCAVVGHFNHSSVAINALQKCQQQLNLPVV